MKRKLLFSALFLVMLSLFAMNASASALPRITPRPDLVLITPTPAPSQVCETLGHSYRQISTKAATCTEPATLVRRCTRCGHNSTISQGAPLGHDMKFIAWDPAPDCVTDGYTVYKCTRCDHTKRSLGEYATGHFSQTTVTKEATCGSDGEKVTTCVDCDYTKTAVIPATGNHKWELTHINRDDVECVAAGTAYYICSVCGDQKNEGVAALGHDWKKHASEAQSCTKDGKQWYKCSRCDETKYDVLKAAGHDWQPEAAVSATCGNDGYATLRCRNCNETKKETIPATGDHSWKDAQIIQAPTCTQNGKVSSVCQMCGKKDSARVIRALGHSYGEATTVKAPTCTAKGETKATCKVCGYVKNSTIDAAGHKWGEWKITKEATEKAEGAKERACKTCGKKDTEAIPRKGAEPTKKPAPTQKPASNKNNAGLTAEYGRIEVFTTSGKVNLRSGPGKENKQVTQVSKSNTCLGELLDAKADKKGVVWFKVEYKNKTCWVTSDYAKAVVGELDGAFRAAEGSLKELSYFYLKSISEAIDELVLEESGYGEAYTIGAANEAVSISGNEYTEYIELKGDSYTIFGVKIGDKLKDAQKKFKNADLVQGAADDMYEGAYVYNVICSPDSLVINDSGFDGLLIVYPDDNGLVEMMILQAYGEE